MSQSSTPSVLHSPPLTAYIRRHADEAPERRAVVDGSTHEELTYGELVTQTQAVARALAESGVGRGDRVGVIAANSLPHVVLVLALADLGAIGVPQNLRLNPREVATNLADARITALVAGEGFIEAAATVADELGVSTRFALEENSHGWAILDRTATGTAVTMGADISGTDTGTLLYTSGTTGTAKGCMLAQQTWGGYAMNMSTSLSLSREDAYLAFLPFFHIAGLGLMLSQLVLGGSVVTQAAADPAQMHANIRQHEVTVVMVVPGVSAPFVNHPDAPAPAESTLRLVVSAVGLEQREVVDAVTERLGVDFIGIYGQTESGTKTTWATAEELRANPGTYGRVMPSMTYRLVDENDRDVADGEPGELLLRGSTVMQGYWERPDATEATLAGGWHHTGDVFLHEGGGRLRMVDRTKYLVKTGGENVYPQEVENVLKGHPDVADVAVAGIPDAHWGETVKAFVIAREGTTPSRADLDAFVRKSVAGYKAPRYIEYVSEIPRNVSGKILKNELTARGTDESQKVQR